MRQSRRTSSALGISNNQGSVTDLHSQHTHTMGSNMNGYGSNAGVGGMGTHGAGGQGFKGMGTPGGGSVHSMQGGYAASPTMGSMGGNNQMGGLSNARSATPIQQQQPPLQQKLSSAPSTQAIPSQAAPSTLPISSAPSSNPALTQIGTSSATPGGVQTPGQQATNLTPPFEMKASFSYTASVDDPNEISFVKGEILTILDNSGKWFNARKMDGQEGIVPR